jgi:hypothetical protein
MSGGILRAFREVSIACGVASPGVLFLLFYTLLLRFFFASLATCFLSFLNVMGYHVPRCILGVQRFLATKGWKTGREGQCASGGVREEGKGGKGNMGSWVDDECDRGVRKGP